MQGCSVWPAYALSRFTMAGTDRKSTRLNSSHTVIYTLSLHDALPILASRLTVPPFASDSIPHARLLGVARLRTFTIHHGRYRSEEHTSELQSHSDLHSFPTRRSSDLGKSPDRATICLRFHSACKAARCGPPTHFHDSPWPV